MLRLSARAALSFCLYFLWFTGPAQAEPAISDLKVEAISHGTVAVRFQISGLPGPTENWVEYGPSHLLGYRTAIWKSASPSPYRSLAIGGLRPDATYYFRAVARSTNGAEEATWYCRGASAGQGYECDGPDAPPRFRTVAAPAERPVPPAPPKRVEHPFPAIDGDSFAVSVDEDGTCVDFQQQLEAAARADSSRNHEVVIPAGATCYGTFVLPPKSGPGVVVVRPSTALERLPPAGMRIDPSFAPLMATISTPRDWSSPSLMWRLALTTPPESECAAPCTEGWRITGLELTHPSHDEIAPVTARVTSVSAWRPGLALVSLDRELPLSFGQSIAVAGTGAVDGIRTVEAVLERAFAVRSEAAGDGASGGWVTLALSIPVESCTPGPQPVCRTSLPHALPEPEPHRITAIEDGRLALSADAVRAWPWASTIELQGWAVDGIAAAYRSDDGLRLARADPMPDCSTDCGTVRLRRALQAFGFDSASGLNGSRLYTVVSESEVRLDDVEEATPATGGGYLTVDPGSFPGLAAFGRNARNIVVDRCWLHGRGFPTRLQTAMGLWSDDSALIDSVVSGVHSWRPVNPLGGNSERGVHGYFAGAARPVSLGDSSRVEIRNNLFENCMGVTVFAEESRRTAELTPRDVAIVGNTFRNDERFRSGSSESDGRYYSIRHAIELKRGARFLIEGNVIEGNWADWTPLGPAIGLLTRGGGPTPNNQIHDIAIRNNVFRRVSTAIQISTVDDNIHLASFPAARIAIENNLFENVDFYRMRSAPSGVNLFEPSRNYGGQVVFLTGPMEDLAIRRNTALDNRGRGPGFFWFSLGRSSGVDVSDNVLTHNHDFSLGGMPAGWRVGDFEARPQGPSSAAFAHVFTRTPGPDPHSKFARNLVLPGVRDSSSADAYDDATPQRNFTKADCEDFYAGFPEIECAGSGAAGETARQRFAEAFPNLREPRDSQGRGADIDRARETAGEIREVRTTTSEAGLKVEYRTDAREACLVDLAPSDDFASFQRQVDAGGELRAVSFEGLEAGRAYHYRIKCRTQTRIGKIELR